MASTVVNNSSLRIALIFEDRSTLRDLGYSADECLDLPYDGEIQTIRETLEKLGHHVTEIPGIESLVAHLASGGGSKWDLAFNMAEGLRGSAREAQIPGILEAYQIRSTFSDSLTTALCQDKQKTKIFLKHHGIPTAKFLLVEVDEAVVDFSKFQKAALSYPVFAKPVAEGSSKGIRPDNIANNPEELMKLVERLKTQFPSQGILIEPFLTGREITVSIIGTGSRSQVIGATEFAWLTKEGEIDQRLSGKLNADFPGPNPVGCSEEMWLGCTHTPETTDTQVQSAYQVALETWKILKCRDAGRVDTRFDTAQSNAIVNVLEVNTITGLSPDKSFFPAAAKNAGVSFEELLTRIIESATSRVGP